MEIRIGGRPEIKALRRRCKHLRKLIWTGRNAYIAVAKRGTEIAAFAFVFRRKAPGGREDFINVIEVIDPAGRNAGLGSALVARVIESARANGSSQVRAYFDNDNAASRALWLKNGFGLTPEGPGAFAVYHISGDRYEP